MNEGITTMIDDGVEMPVTRPEHLIAMKLATGIPVTSATWSACLGFLMWITSSAAGWSVRTWDRPRQTGWITWARERASSSRLVT